MDTCTTCTNKMDQEFNSNVQLQEIMSHGTCLEIHYFTLIFKRPTSFHYLLTGVLGVCLCFINLYNPLPMQLNNKLYIVC